MPKITDKSAINQIDDDDIDFNDEDFFLRPTPSKSINKPIGDRFIPLRSADFDAATKADLENAKLNGSFDQRHFSPMNNALCHALWGESFQSLNSRSAVGLKANPINYLKFFKPKPSTAHRTASIDAPDILDDYYTDTLSWHASSEILCVALSHTLYTYNVNSKKNTILSTCENESEILAVSGDSQNTVLARTDGSLGSLCAYDNLTGLSIMDRTSTTVYWTIHSDNNGSFYLIDRLNNAVDFWDPRCFGTQRLMSQQGHLKAITLDSKNKTLALPCEQNSRGLVKLFDIQNLSKPVKILDAHKAIGKAVEFSPYDPNLLATGGGFHDEMIKLWDVTTGRLLTSGKSNSQVSGIKWVDKYNLFVTKGSQMNNTGCWTILPNEDQLFCGDIHSVHSDRVLYLAQNPTDPSHLVTGSSDETICFWSIKERKNKKPVADTRSALNNITIR